MSGCNSRGCRSRRLAPRFVVALDYDRTFKRLPLLWTTFLQLCLASGGHLVLVTTHADSPTARDAIHRALRPYTPQIIFSAQGSKLAAADRCGYPIDVWIEDFSAAIGSLNLLKSAKP